MPGELYYIGRVLGAFAGSKRCVEYTVDYGLGSLDSLLVFLLEPEGGVVGESHSLGHTLHLSDEGRFGESGAGG